MTQSRQQTGDRGEALACAYLREKGYRIITTNWHCKQGEIDIVAADGDCLVFVEVRTRKSANTEAAFASINPRKRKKLTQTAYAYLNAHQLDDTEWRIDMAAIALPYNKPPVIDHVENALDW